MANITIIGAGAWGKTLGTILTENNHTVSYWTRHTSSLSNCFSSAEYVVFALPSSAFQIIEQFKPVYPSSCPLIQVTKGLPENTSSLFLSNYFETTLDTPVAVLSGPNLSKEIANKLPAAAVIASKDPVLNSTLQQLFSTQYFRCYTSEDRPGVELGGILKNIIAIAAGILDGLQLGNNAKAALIARGLQEMIRFGTAFGAKEHTFFGLSGLGDLMTTCNSDLSRNWQYGYQLIHATQSISNTVEGVRTTKIVHQLASEKNIPMPITNEVHDVIYLSKNPKKAIDLLMSRTLKSEM